MRIKLRNISFEVAEGQYDAAWKDINAGKWEPETFDILDHFVGSTDVLLDLGAWIGAVSLYAANLASEVYALEPDPVAFAELEKNAGQNPSLISKIKCCKLAISGFDGKLTLYARSQYGLSSSSLLPRSRDKLSDVQVEAMTLREFIRSQNIKKVDFIKMDIEGGEFELMPSVSEILEELNLPTLYISFHYNYLTEHQYFLNVNSRFISKVLMKLEKWTGIEIFRNNNNKIVLKCLQSLKGYEFIYTASGQEISHALLVKSPALVKKNNLVFTNKKWL